MFKKNSSLQKKFLISTVICYCFLTLATYFLQKKLLYHPNASRVSLQAANLRDTQEITLTTEDNLEIIAWYHKPENNNPIIIFLHGNAGNLNNRSDKLKKLISLGYGFIIPSWRGFGGNSGEPSQEGLYKDGDSAVKFLLDKGFNTDNIIVVGESLGTGIASELALHYKFKGLYLITPYTSIADRAQEIVPFMLVKPLLKDNFNNIDKVKNINQPLLIMHGTKDIVIPYSHAKKLFNKAIKPKKLITFDGAGHSNYDIDLAFKEMVEFFK